MYVTACHEFTAFFLPHDLCHIRMGQRKEETDLWRYRMNVPNKVKTQIVRAPNRHFVLIKADRTSL
jgi:hypothetical protein